MKIEFHEEFSNDFEAATRYFKTEASQTVAEAFVEDVAAMLREIEQGPERFSILYWRVRRARLRQFKKYSIHYMIQEGEILVGTLIHGSRHPDTGKGRFTA